eukprot:765973-Hanusia_phi.AAC.3
MGHMNWEDAGRETVADRQGRPVRHVHVNSKVRQGSGSKKKSCNLNDFICISRELGLQQLCEEDAINKTFIDLAQESDGSLKLVNFSQFATALGNLARKAGMDQFSPRKWRGRKTLLVEEVLHMMLEVDVDALRFIPEAFSLNDWEKKAGDV